MPGCCVDHVCTPETCMCLPDGTTCGQCIHLDRCMKIYGREPGDTVCDWFPRKFQIAGSRTEGGLMDHWKEREQRIRLELEDWKRRVQVSEPKDVFAGIYQAVLGGGLAVRMIGELFTWAEFTILELFMAHAASDAGHQYWERRLNAVENGWPSPLELSVMFHEAYERESAQVKWQTNELCRGKPWSALPEANKRAMTRTSRAVLGVLWKRFGMTGAEPASTGRNCEICGGVGRIGGDIPCPRCGGEG